MTTQEWLQAKIAEEAGMQVEEITLDAPFESFSLDSLSVITLAYELESFTGKESIDPSVFSEYNTINKLSEWVNQQSQ
jgi:acyl carrier protein